MACVSVFVYVDSAIRADLLSDIIRNLEFSVVMFVISFIAFNIAYNTPVYMVLLKCN